MATIALKVLWHLSPRIIVIPAPTQVMSVQDLSSSIKDIEDEPANLSYPRLVKTSGGEDLGGGVSVGITAELQDSQIAFEQRTISIASGTVTTANTNGTILIDSTATFLADGIVTGDIIYNATDKSVATIISADSETQITSFLLDDGIENDWDFGDEYKIWKSIECEINGGNIVAIDVNSISISAFLPTAFTYAIRTSSSSATQTEQSAIRFASYQGAVWIDELSINMGTEFPMGTREFPVNNLTDAHAIAENVGLQEFGVIGNLTIGGSHAIPNYTIRGQNALNSLITIDQAADVSNVEIFEATVTGYLDGNVVIRESVLGTSDLVAGFVFETALGNGQTITLGGGGEAHILNCYSGTPGSGTPTIDMNVSGTALAMRNYNGGIKIVNKSGPEAISFDLNSGQVILDDTITNGEIVARGVGKLIDINGDPILSGPWNGCTIINEMVNPVSVSTFVWNDPSATTLLTDVAFIKNMEGGRWKIDTGANQMIFYQDDNTTEVARFDLFDSAGSPTSSSPYERTRV